MVVDGWTILAHPLLLDQLVLAVVAMEKAKAADPADCLGTAQAKLLATLARLVFQTIPADPTRPEYRQGSTLGGTRKHWFRAEFGNGRFRLFFRYDTKSKIIIFAWVNDQHTLRTCGSKTGACRVFQGMLDRGSPPDDWQALLVEASEPATIRRLNKAKPEQQSKPGED